MKRLRALWLLLCAVALTGRAQLTVNYQFFNAQNSGLPYTNCPVYLTPGQNFGCDTNGFIGPVPIAAITDTNGNCSFMNVIPGRVYQVLLVSPFGNVTNTNGFPCGLTGTVNGFNYNGFLLGQVFAYYHLTNSVASGSSSVTVTLSNGVYFVAVTPGSIPTNTVTNIVAGTNVVIVTNSAGNLTISSTGGGGSGGGYYPIAGTNITVQISGTNATFNDPYLTGVSNTAAATATGLTTVSNGLGTLSNQYVGTSNYLNSVSNNLVVASNLAANAATAANLATVSNQVLTVASNLTTVSNTAALAATAANLTTVSNQVSAVAANLTTVSNTAAAAATAVNLTTVSNGLVITSNYLNAVSNNVVTASNLAALAVVTNDTRALTHTNAANSFGGSYAGNGASLTNIPYSALTGTPSIPSTNTLQAGSAALTNYTAGTVTGNGATITNIPYSALTGTPPTNLFVQTNEPRAVTVSNYANVLNGAFSGTVGALTNGGWTGASLTNGINHGNAFRSPGGGSGSEQFGLGASTPAAGSTALGDSATTVGTGNVAIGENANTGNNFGLIAIGYAAAVDANVNGVDNIAIGPDASADFGNLGFEIALGYNAAASANGAAAFGQNSVANLPGEITLGVSTNFVYIPGNLSIAGTVSNFTATGATITNATVINETNSMQLTTNAVTLFSTNGFQLTTNTVTLNATNGTTLSTNQTDLTSHRGTSTDTNTTTIAGTTFNSQIYQLEVAPAKNVALTTGANPDINPGTNSAIDFTGYNTACGISGFIGGTNGYMLLLNFTTANAVTISNLSAYESTATNRILTGQGDTVVTGPGASAILRYNTIDQYWHLLTVNQGGYMMVYASNTTPYSFTNTGNSFTGNGAGLSNLTVSYVVSGTVPINNGGTGQTNASAALSALGGASLTANNTFTGSNSLGYIISPNLGSGLTYTSNTFSGNGVAIVSLVVGQQYYYTPGSYGLPEFDYLDTNYESGLSVPSLFTATKSTGAFINFFETSGTVVDTLVVAATNLSGTFNGNFNGLYTGSGSGIATASIPNAALSGQVQLTTARLTETTSGGLPHTLTANNTSAGSTLTLNHTGTNGYSDINHQVNGVLIYADGVGVTGTNQWPYNQPYFEDYAHLGHMYVIYPYLTGGLLPVNSGQEDWVWYFYQTASATNQQIAANEVVHVHQITGVLDMANGNVKTNLNVTGVITNENLTAGDAIYADANQVLQSSSTTSTELGYVHGVTSAIQTQLNAMVPQTQTNFTNALIYSTYYTNTYTGNTNVTVNMTNGQFQMLLVTTNTYLTVTNPTSYALKVDLELRIDSVGNHSFSNESHLKIPGGFWSSLTTNANAVDRLSIVTDSTLTNYDVDQGQNYK